MLLGASILTALLFGVGAPAAEGGVEFAWDAPSEGCPSEGEVVAELERLLGGPVAEQGSRRLSAIARVRREVDGAWDLRLWTITNDATRQRSMVGSDCAVLAEAAALLAAMAIDPSVLERMGASDAAVEQAEQAQEIEGEEPPKEDPPHDEPPPQEESPPQDEPPPPELEPSGRRFTIGLRAHGGISYGDLPGVGAILRAAFTLTWDRARLELEGHYAFNRVVTFTGDPPRGAALTAALGVVRGCAVARHRPSRLEFPMCAGFEGGAELGVGFGFDGARRGSIPWLAIDLAPGLVWAPIRNVAIGLTVEPWVALVRRRFEIDNLGVIWRPLPVGVRVLAGIEARF